MCALNTDTNVRFYIGWMRDDRHMTPICALPQVLT